LLVNPATITAEKGPFRQLEWLKKGPKQPQRENGQTLKVNETRKNYDAGVHGYNFFLLLTTVSFDKLLKK